MRYCNNCNELTVFKRVYDTRLLFMIALSGSLFIWIGIYSPVVFILVPLPVILYYFCLPVVCQDCESQES